MATKELPEDMSLLMTSHRLWNRMLRQCMMHFPMGHWDKYFGIVSASVIDAQQMCWDPIMVQWHLSNSAHEVKCETGSIVLPSQRTLGLQDISPKLQLDSQMKLTITYV